MAKEGESIAGLINAMSRLERVMAGAIFASKKIKEQSDKQNQLSEISNQLKADITAAVTSPVLFKKLNEVLARNLGGSATPEIKQNLAKASVLRRQYMSSRMQQQKMSQKIQQMIAQRPHAANRAVLNKLNQKITDAQAKLSNIDSAGFKQRWAMKAALSRAQKAAIGKGSNLGKISKVGIASKALGQFGVALKAGTGIVEFFNDKMKESGDIIGHYSRYSLGGLQASSMMYIRDIQRNIYSSRALSSSMYDFAKANSDMKDSWKNINMTLDKLTLTFGTLGSKMWGSFGDLLDPLADRMDGFMKSLKDGTSSIPELIAGMIPGGLGFVILDPLRDALKKVGETWRSKDDEMKEWKDRIERRKAIFGGVPGAPEKPGDIHPLEKTFADMKKKPIPMFTWPDRPKPPDGIADPDPEDSRESKRIKIIKDIETTEMRIKIDEKAREAASMALEETKKKIEDIRAGGIDPSEKEEFAKLVRERAAREIGLKKIEDDKSEAMDMERKLKMMFDGTKTPLAKYDSKWTVPGDSFGTFKTSPHLMA